MSVNSKMTAIANAIRSKTGRTDTLTLDEMATAIGGISTGIDTSDATASADEILQGETAYVDGEKITGTIPTKTSSDLTTSGATITVPAGYYASQATKSVSTATQATPSVSVSSSGLITASATQTEGYVSAGTKSGTKQLTTQAAKTITPTKSSQTAVNSGVYTTGAVTVAAIPSQYITTTDATAGADEIMSGETAYVNGSKVTGTFSIDSELSAQDNLIAQIQAVVDNLPEAGGSGGGGSIETCTVTIRKETSRGYVYLNRCMIMTDDGIAEQWHGATGDANFIILPSGTAGEYILNIVCGTSLDIKGTGGMPAWNITGSYTTLYAKSLDKVLKINGDTTIIFRDDD